MTLKVRDVAAEIDNSTYPNHSGTGAVPWLELVEGTTRERLIERLAQAYLSDGHTAAGDADAVLDDLR